MKRTILVGVMMAGLLGATAPAFAQGSPCQNEIMTLRGDIETKGKALQAAAKRKAQPTEVCPLFRSYSAAEGKFVKYLDENASWCQVPEDALKQLKENHGKTAATAKKVCQVAENGPPAGAGGPARPPAQGMLSSGLGIGGGLPSATQSTERGGVFDTLSGSAVR